MELYRYKITAIKEDKAYIFKDNFCPLARVMAMMVKVSQNYQITQCIIEMHKIGE